MTAGKKKHNPPLAYPQQRAQLALDRADSHGAAGAEESLFGSRAGRRTVEHRPKAGGRAGGELARGREEREGREGREGGVEQRAGRTWEVWVVGIGNRVLAFWELRAV